MLINTEEQIENDVVEDAPSTTPSGYHEIRVGTLRIGSITQFDIFTVPESEKAPVLYTRRNTPINKEVYQSLADLQGNAVYITDEDLSIYLGYVEKNLPFILETNNLSIPVKVEVMYESAQRVTEGLLALSDAPNMIPRARALVITISDFIYREKNFFKHFLKICSYDYSENRHGVNVLIYSLCLAQRIGIRDVGWIQNFCTGALLLDLGKGGINKKILNQNGPLNSSQWKTMKMHTIWSYEALQSHGIIDEVILNIARCHHEKINGTGYPDGLSGDEIPQYVRIVTICDIFDALTTKRAYSDATDSFKALKMMQDKMTGEIDPDIFKVFVKMMSS